MTCEELEARLKSQKAALLRLQALEMAYRSNDVRLGEYYDAKQEYERTVREYMALK